MALKFLFQKKVVLILIILSLVLVFSVKAGWQKNTGFLDTLNPVKFASQLFNRVNKSFQISAQEYGFYFFPHFPQRLKYLLSETEILNEELVKFNEELNEELKKSDCNFAISQCLPKITSGGIKCASGMVLGTAYQNAKEIDEKKWEITDRIDNLSFLREVLETEMNTGLLKEMETLREDVAGELKNNLNTVLAKSDEIIKKAKENQDLYNKDYTKNCTASCQPGPVCGFGACLKLGVGPQKNIQVKAKIEVGLDDIKLGKVGIDKFGLGLPDKLKFPSLGDLPITIPSQTLNLCFPLKPINVSVQPPSLPTLPYLSFTCPKLPWPDLKTPKIPILKIPKEISFPGFSREIKWCPEMKTSAGQISQLPINEIEEFKKKIDEEINRISEEIKKAADEKLKENLEEYKKTLQKEQEEYEKMKEGIPTEAETPSVELKMPEASKEYQYQSPESKGLEQNISLSYQCGQTAGVEEVETKAETNWHYATLSWLMKNCVELPTMTGQLGLLEKAANCYKSDKVLETIVNECDFLWQKYLREYRAPLPPLICQKIRYKYNYDTSIDIAAAIQCQNLFKQEGLIIPSECDYSYIRASKKEKIVEGKIVVVYSCPGPAEPFPKNPKFPLLKDKLCFQKNFNPVPILEKKCQEQELKNKYPKEPPEPCKVLPLFTNHIEETQGEVHSGKSTSCPGQKLLNLPLGFGGGIGFNCPVGLPQGLPKIVLPDIVIPDIILPEFSVPPFFRVKLPKIIIEDLILPDIELCDFNDCANIFPYLSFKAPQLRSSSFDVSTPVPGLPGLDLRTRIDLPSINFSSPQINLFNLLLPELKLPEISVPSPKIDWGITGVDMSAIFQLIFTFLLNAMSIPDFGGCLTFQIPSVFLSITFPDYYFSFLKFPEIPKIPFCQDVNNFCKNVKNALGKNGWLNKAKEIETEFNKTINKIQKELDKVNEASQDVQTTIDEVFKDVYGPAIYDAVVEQLARKGLSLQDYMNPKTKEIDLSKIPVPGVFPIKTIDERECLPVSIPQTSITLKIVDKNIYPNKKIEKLSPTQYVIYAPVDLPSEIPINWPTKLKDGIKLSLGYDLPDIPLSNLSYKKEFTFKTVGFQPRTFYFDFGKSNEGECLAEKPSGGNPFPIFQITGKINEIKNIKSEIDTASQKVRDILR